MLLRFRRRRLLCRSFLHSFIRASCDSRWRWSLLLCLRLLCRFFLHSFIRARIPAKINLERVNCKGLNEFAPLVYPCATRPYRFFLKMTLVTLVLRVSVDRRSVGPYGFEFHCQSFVGMHPIVFLSFEYQAVNFCSLVPSSVTVLSRTVD